MKQKNIGLLFSIFMIVLCTNVNGVQEEQKQKSQETYFRPGRKHKKNSPKKVRTDQFYSAEKDSENRACSFVGNSENFFRKNAIINLCASGQDELTKEKIKLERRLLQQFREKKYPFNWGQTEVVRSPSPLFCLSLAIDKKKLFND